MLCQFTFENFKSFKDETTLDFFADETTTHEKSLIIDKDGERFLPVIALYGPNGGGKSNTLEALEAVISFVITKIAIVQPEGILDTKQNINYMERLLNYTFEELYYKFDDNYKDKPLKFDILFRNEGFEFKYQLSILDLQIIEENLYARKISEENAKIIFERNQENCYLGEDLSEIAVGKIRPTISLLSYIGMGYDIEIINNIISWFAKVEYLNFNDSKLDKQAFLPDNKTTKSKFLNMLKEMDINITDFRTEENSDGNIISLYTEHTLPNGMTYELDFDEQSSGTKKLFGFLLHLIYSLEYGDLVIADELDAKLHPKLLRYIIELFTNPEKNKHGAQLLFTSHSISTMIPEIFRRDEIWFCALNQNNASTLYPLTTFQEENTGESYGTQYMKGRYGADPYLRKILDWGSLK